MDYRHLVNTLLDISDDFPGGFLQLYHAALSFSLQSPELESALYNLIAERLFMWLVGPVPDGLNFLDRKNLVYRRLCQVLPPELAGRLSPASEVVRSLAECQATIASARSTTKEGLSKIDPKTAWDLLDRQGHRCALCGVPFSASVRARSKHFPSGMEPLSEDFHLDHVLPFYLGGNFLNRQLLCRACNLLKLDLIGVHEDASILSGNHLRPRAQASRRRRAGFWTLAFSPRCSHINCFLDASRSMLFVHPKETGAPWMYGHLAISCADHAQQDDQWIHAVR